MEETITFITRFVNHLLGPAAAALLSWLHIKPENPELPVPQHVVMGILVLIIGAFLAFYLRSRLSVDRPGPLQQIAEALVTNPLGFGIKDLLEENSGHDSDSLRPLAHFRVHRSVVRLHDSSLRLLGIGDCGGALIGLCRETVPAIRCFSVSPAARCPGTTSWRRNTRRQ